VLVNEVMMNDFQHASNFVSLSILPAKQSTRYVVAAQTDWISMTGRGGGRGKGGRGGGGRGSGGGRGKGRGQDNRGHGRGHGGGGRGSETRYHSPEEWNKLSHEQRMKILEARGMKRNVSAIITDGGGGGDSTPQDEAPQQSNRQRTDAGGNAGDQFGPHAHRNVGMMRTSARMSSINWQMVAAREVSRAAIQDVINAEMFIKLDLHADTVCVGVNCHIIEYMQEMVNVEPDHPQYKAMQNVSIVQAASAYDDPETGVTYILVFNQALDFTQSLPLTLVNLNQMRMNGIIVDDVPKHLAPNPTDTSHSIFVPEHNLCIKLQMRGVLSVWPGRKPSLHEIQNCTWVHMTPQASWDPHSADFSENETIADGRSDRSISFVASIASSIYSLKMQGIENPVLRPASLMDCLDFTRLAQETMAISSTMSGKRRSTVDKEELAKRRQKNYSSYFSAGCQECLTSHPASV